MALRILAVVLIFASGLVIGAYLALWAFSGPYSYL
jgi:hypothetical protein